MRKRGGISVPPPLSADARVYFIKAGPYVKIGFSVSPRRRLAMLDSYCPEPPQLIAEFAGGRFLEHRLQYFFRDHHARREWFYWCQEIENVAYGELPDLSGLPDKRTIRLVREGMGMVNKSRYGRAGRKRSDRSVRLAAIAGAAQ